MNKRWWIVSAGVVLVGVFVAAQFVPLREWLVTVVAWTNRVGWVGAGVYAGVYVAATVAMVPGAFLTMGAGYIWGVLWGTVLISVASTSGAALAFVVGRYLARDKILAWTEGSMRAQAIDRAVERDGFKVVFLMRLVPVVPFNFLNYLLGLTGVSFGRYVLASWIGMLPGTLMYVYLGAVAGEVTELVGGVEQPSGLQYAMLGVGLIAVVTLTVLMTRRARQELERLADEEGVELTGGEAEQ